MLNRKQAESLVWSRTHRDYKGVVTISGGKKIRCVLVLRDGGTQSVPLSSLTEAELADKLPKFASFEAAKAHASELDAACKAASDRVKAIPGVGSGPMGLTPDAVRYDPDYRDAKRDYDGAFARVREFYSWYTKAFTAELRAEREAKRKSNG
jgi:hypothetical protein